MRRRLVVLLAGFAIACDDGPTAPEPTPTAVSASVGAASWASRAQYPANVFDATSAAITDPATGRTTMYVIGGYPACCGAGRITAAVKAYDATADRWSPKARYPIEIHATNGAAELDGRIYVSGGFTRRWNERLDRWTTETVNRLYVYNPGTDTWTRKRDLPIATVNGSSVGYRGKLYVATPCYFEGPCPGAVESVVWRYDPGTDRWVLFERRPRDWWNVAAGVIGGKLYLVEEFGGALDILDLTTGTWTAGPKRPYRACNAAATTLQAKLYLFGFCDDYPSDPSIQDRSLVFDPATNKWSEISPAPVRAAADAALARVLVNGQPRLSLVKGTRPDNHYQFSP